MISNAVTNSLKQRNNLSFAACRHEDEEDGAYEAEEGGDVVPVEFLT